MNKKVMALAVASAFVAPAAFAQSSNVQLYGRAVVGIDNYSATGSSNQNLLVNGLVVNVPGGVLRGHNTCGRKDAFPRRFNCLPQWSVGTIATASRSLGGVRAMVKGRSRSCFNQRRTS